MHLSGLGVAGIGRQRDESVGTIGCQTDQRIHSAGAKVVRTAQIASSDQREKVGWRISHLGGYRSIGKKDWAQRPNSDDINTKVFLNGMD